jgi:hypothetical protein
MSEKERLCYRCKNAPAAYYSSYCKACASAYQTAQLKKTGYKWPKKRRAEIKELLHKAKDRPCADCGIKYPPYVMDFDHVHGEKEFAVSLSVQRGHALETVQKEIDKCEVVCANCHRIRTHARLADWQ